MSEACRSCGAPIVWATTTSGKLMPVDDAPTTKGLSLWKDENDVQRVATVWLHTSHFATCPHADDWRKR